ncbi:MAG: hypothetical protein KDD68_19875 [Bdellovibrionales bacterium]|nr:hypothetical protein [Bdellovibrionales bacterium]
MNPIKNIVYCSLIAGALLLLSSCMSVPKKVILDSSTDGSKPEWVKNTKVSWEDGPIVKYRATSTIWGDERLDGCYQLARLNAKEALLTEISEDIRGETNHVVEGLSEEAENMLNQLRSATYQGNITGLKFREEYYERYEVKDDVRVQCFVLGEIRKSDYNKVKRRVFNRVTSVDPELKEAIKRKGIRFFDKENKDKEEANPGKPVGLDNSVVPVEVSDVAVGE